MRVYVPLAASVLVGLLLASCSSTSKNQQAKDKTAIPVTDADEQVLKTDPIERNYDPHVIMKRAEAFFEKEDYAEAAVEYQHFLDLHRAHMLAPYAQYRLGLSHFKQVTTLDRDPEHVRQTIEAMEKLLKEYPGSAYELDAHTNSRKAANTSPPTRSTWASTTIARPRTSLPCIGSSVCLPCTPTWKIRPKPTTIWPRPTRTSARPNGLSNT